MEFFFDAALREAEIAASEGNVPVGCVIVCDDVIVASSHNTKNSSGIAINHAAVIGSSGFCSQLRNPQTATIPNATITRIERIVLTIPTSLTPLILM